MKRHPTRGDNLRRALAQEAARIMAEHGVGDFLIAKRKAAERLGVVDGAALLPKNREIESALAEYQRLFGGQSHLSALHAQRSAPLRMQRREVRFAAEQSLVLGERALDLAVLRQQCRAIGDPEALGRLALGDQEIAYAVLGHDARGFLRQRAPDIVAARVSLHGSPPY